MSTKLIENIISEQNIAMTFMKNKTYNSGLMQLILEVNKNVF